jgi:creatinine amidohydrolase
MLHGFIPPDRYFAYLTWTQIRDLPDKANTVLILPCGAIEQHGPHLPIAVDSAIATGVIGKALEQLDPEIPAYALPPLYYGKSNEHWHFPGTLTLSAQSLGAGITEVAESLYRSGFRKLILANAHGGQPQVMEIVARDLHQRFADFAVFPWFVWRVPHNIKAMLTEREAAEGMHAGDGETSLMLALLPDRVQMDRAVCEYPELSKRSLDPEELISLEGALPVAWMTRDISRSGVVGDATAASREKGEAILAQLAAGWVRAIGAAYRFELPQISAAVPAKIDAQVGL